MARRSFRTLSEMQAEPPDTASADPAEKLRAVLGDLADIRAPHEAEEPILAPGPRAAVFEWLGEIRARDELAAVGCKPRATALLYGPPGTGKTTLAHHLSARLGLPLVLVGSENLYRAYLGEAEQRMEKLFRALARSEGQCVVFLDEIDAIGSRRSDGGPGGGASQARNSMLTVLLRRIEMFSGLLLAATNRHDILDPALWRRFHLQVSVDLPGDDERFAILKRYGLPFAFSDEELDLLTDLTDGASPALLRGLMEGAKRTLVLAERAAMATDPVKVFGKIVASLAPPPEMRPPPLWAETDQLLPQLGAIAWPPPREAQ